MLNKFLFKQVDNTALVVFRIFFGLLIFFEGIGAILTGWVKRTLVDPEFTFTFIGFEWLTPIQQTLRNVVFHIPSLSGGDAIPVYGMYFYFFLMGVFGFLVMLGYRYKWSMAGFTVLWTAAYLMQKTSYNNHYYLLVLLCLLMLIVPAHHYASLDVKRNPSLKRNYMPNWCRWFFILQMLIVYTYASVAKLYPDWLSGDVTRNLMAGRKNFPIVGEFLQQEWVHYLLTYVGIGFDLLVIPMLLWKRTRIFAFVCAVVFHLFNSFVLHIGIFPYMSLALCLFFFEPKTIRNLFLRNKTIYTADNVIIPSYKNVLIVIASIYFVLQIALPLRHWTIPGDVLWTEEGHRLSWRMMLRSKVGYVQLRVVDPNSGVVVYENPSDHLTPKQARRLASNPDMLWQFVQYLKKEYNAKGKEVEIYAEGRVKANNSPYHRLYDPKVDLSKEEWSHFKHHDWLLPYVKAEKK